MVAAAALLLLLLFSAFAALGTWQVERRSWKLALIERVDQRVHALPVPAPGPLQWPQVSAATDEYRRVQATGRFLHAQETLVQASTDLGGGYWVLTPLQRADGSIVLVNRGFVPPELRERSTRSADAPLGVVTITGLLRMSEPRGAFLRRNRPDEGRWYSRDVAAIAAARGLSQAAPYFIDEEARPGPEWPRAGLTVIAFPNNHLVYALTWYGLAVLVTVAGVHLARDALQRRRRMPAPRADAATHRR